MTDVLAEFLSTTAAQEFETELSLVQKRYEWLKLILNAEDTELAAKITEQQELGEKPDSATESRDLAAVSRAGPCAGYEQLKTWSFCLPWRPASVRVTARMPSSAASSNRWRTRRWSWCGVARRMQGSHGQPAWSQEESAAEPAEASRERLEGSRRKETSSRDRLNPSF